jgi:hypothetical protein
VSSLEESLETKHLASVLEKASSIQDEIEQFAATAPTYDIPAEVTGTSTTVFFSTVPAWYTAMPKLKKFRTIIKSS